MVALSYPVYDADNHLYETADAFLKYLPKEYAKEFQYVQVDGRTKLAVAGKLTEYIPNPTFEVVAPPGAHELWYRAKNVEGKTMRELSGKPIRTPVSFRQGDARLPLLDQQGIYASLIFPTLASVVEERMNEDHQLMGSVLSGFNRWLGEEWGFAREGRLFSVPMISLADVDIAIAELESVVKAGARVIGIRPAPVPGYRGSVSPGSAHLDPFWARVAESGIFVSLHLSDSGYDKHYRAWSGGMGREMVSFDKSDPLKDCLDPMSRPIMDMISAMIAHGVFKRHPNLRVTSTENGAGWVEYLLSILHRVHGQNPRAFGEDPVETFRKHVFVVPFYEDNVARLAELIGVDRILFGSDFPHPEGLGEPLDFLHELGSFNDDDKQKIMSSNLKGLLEGARN